MTTYEAILIVVFDTRIQQNNPVMDYREAIDHVRDHVTRDDVQLRHTRDEIDDEAVNAYHLVLGATAGELADALR